jgi:hypothetical protein
MVKDASDRRRIADDYTRVINRSYIGDTAETEEWREAQRNLRTLIELAREDSASVGLAIFPVLVELNDSYPFQAACDAIANFAGAEGIPVHDLLEGFRGENGPSLWAAPLDQHPNARGHANVSVTSNHIKLVSVSSVYVPESTRFSNAACAGFPRNATIATAASPLRMVASPGSAQPTPTPIRPCGVIPRL